MTSPHGMEGETMKMSMIGDKDLESLQKCEI